jgi:hypothetical protein
MAIDGGAASSLFSLHHVEQDPIRQQNMHGHLLTEPVLFIS